MSLPWLLYVLAFVFLIIDAFRNGLRAVNWFSLAGASLVLGGLILPPVL